MPFFGTLRLLMSFLGPAWRFLSHFNSKTIPKMDPKWDPKSNKKWIRNCSVFYFCLTFVGQLLGSFWSYKANRRFCPNPEKYAFCIGKLHFCKNLKNFVLRCLQKVQFSNAKPYFLGWGNFACWLSWPPNAPLRHAKQVKNVKLSSNSAFSPQELPESF